MGEGDTLLNAILGAVVTIVLSFTVFSPLLGGAVAGYLQRGDRGDGVRVGAISGGIAALPFLLFIFFFGGFVFAGPMMRGGVGIPGGFVILVLVAFVFAFLWNVGLGGAGGYLGNYLAMESTFGD